MGGHVSVVDKCAHKILMRISLWNIRSLPKDAVYPCIRKGGIFGFESLCVFTYNLGLPNRQVFWSC